MKKTMLFIPWVVTLFCIFTLTGCSTKITSKPKLFASGFIFPEGPALDKEGNLFLVDNGGGMIYKVTPDGNVSVIKHVGNCNDGLLFDKNGNLYVASCGLEAIMKIDTEGELTLVTDASEGKALLGPNDMAWDNHGRLYFTDPKRSGKRNPVGGIYYIDINGKTTRFDKGLAYPNGIAFDLDKTHVYVAESEMNRVWKYKVNPDGSSGGREVFIKSEESFVPDGMKLDVKGNLWIAVYRPSELWCVSPEGKKLLSIPIPARNATNLTFGGSDMRTIYITAVQKDRKNSSVFTVRAPVAGVPIIPE
ncbi:MAG: SMP-30/gluconolactonase/LRE family protein [Candidatus Latescibacteria bacterium]|nr:SMP-30/gluconolactonase/LRE family protein [Candidatus Latescibacterota bacterium]